MKHIGLFAAGLLFGTAGLKILTSKDAKKVYAHTTAASVREGADDIYTDAKVINDRRAAEAEAETIEDTSAQEA